MGCGGSMTADDISMMDRAVGALLGLACGDAVGTTLEFRRPGSFEPIRDMVGGGPFDLRAGEWTDDTSMALCLAESILDRDGLDPDDQLRRYLRWADEGYLSSNGKCFDIGITTRSQLERFRKTGAAHDSEVDEESAANGSLMRLAAVPIRWHRDLVDAAERSGASSRTTHGATRPVDACRVLGAAVAALISGVAADDVLAPDFWSWGPLHPAIEEAARGSWRHKEPPAIRGSGYCVDALEAALWSVASADGFEDAALRASNLGDDADTTAAIAGQIAGARWGVSGIPARWREQVVNARRIESLARHLFAAGGGASGGLQWHHDEAVHAWWVTDGLLAGEYPGNPDGGRATEKLNLLVDAGIRTFVDVTTPQDSLAEYDTVLSQIATRRQLDLRRTSFPIPDLGVVADEIYDEIVTAVDDARRYGGVYIHCWGGVGRTGTVVACWLGREVGTLDEALRRLHDARAGSRKAHRPCPESHAQRALLERRFSRTHGH